MEFRTLSHHYILPPPSTLRRSNEEWHFFRIAQAQRVAASLQISCGPVTRLTGVGVRCLACAATERELRLWRSIPPPGGKTRPSQPSLMSESSPPPERERVASCRQTDDRTYRQADRTAVLTNRASCPRIPDAGFGLCMACQCQYHCKYHPITTPTS
jgi:hypothetical protein